LYWKSTLRSGKRIWHWFLSAQ